MIVNITAVSALSVVAVKLRVYCDLESDFDWSRQLGTYLSTL